MKPLFLAASSLALLGLAACTPSGPPKARAALDCPQRQGDLTRTAAAADGKSCTYRTSDGSDVTLQLVATHGDPRAALAALETSLAAPSPELVKGEKEAQVAMGEAAKAQGAAEVAQGEALKAEAAAKGDVVRTTETAAAKVAEQARADAANAPGDDTDVDVPGLHIQAHEDGVKGDKAHIDLPGIHIDADDDSDTAKIKVGGVTIDAENGAARIRNYRAVRLRGEAFSREKRGIRASYFFTGNGLPEGLRFVGYEAAGPKSGPITVAIVRSTVDSDEIDMHGHALRDIKRLVRRNSGS
jgi:hypothetical protein